MEGSRRLPRAEPPGESSASQRVGVENLLYQLAFSSVTTKVVTHSVDTLQSSPRRCAKVHYSWEELDSSKGLDKAGCPKQ